MARRRFLVTGGTGFIGAALVRRLVAEGHDVASLDNDWRGSAGRLADLADRVRLLQGDIRDAAAVQAAVEGVDCVCHLAYVNGTEFFYSQPELVLDVALRGMLNVLDACRAHGVRDLVLASSSEVYQTPPAVPTDESAPLAVPDVLNPRYSYGGGKIACELLAVNYGRTGFDRVAIFRPHNVYGPQMGWEHVLPQFILRLQRLAAAQPAGVIDFPIQGDGSDTRAFVHVDDFTDGLYRVIERGEHLGIYHIGSTDEVSVAALARTVARCFGREIRLVAGAAPAGGTRRRCPDIGKLTRLGYAPKVPLDDGVRRMADWYVAHAGEAPPATS